MEKNYNHKIKETKEKHDWIKSIRLEESSRDLGFHLSSVIMNAFDSGIEYCKKKRIEYEYLGNVDGDIILEPMFFEKLMKEFEEDDMMGVAGDLNDNATIPAPVSSYWPNDYGLYNMAGNVSEWVQDVYRPQSFEDFDEFNFDPGDSKNAHLQAKDIAKAVLKIIDFDGVVTDITIRPQRLEIKKK